MQTIEFETKIHKGTIQLPSEYAQWSEYPVRVVLQVRHPDFSPKPCRTPHPAIAGKGKTIGDIVSPIVDEADWECLRGSP